MNRFIDVALKTALLLASIGSVLSLVQMLIEVFTPVRYYWWAAIVMIGSTAVLASAIRLRERPSSTSLDGATPKRPHASSADQADRRLHSA
jgi:hypothetical protein